jgi:phage shock protein C
MDTRKLYRSQNDRMIAGVCGGLGKYFHIDATLVRLIFIILLFLGGHGFLIYLIMWIIVPAEPQLIVDQTPSNREVPPPAPTASEKK